MITKCKFLKTLFTRSILPAAGPTIGKILYTSTALVGRRRQFVIDLDAKTVKQASINAYPADATVSPGNINEITGMLAPSTDKSLYGFGLATQLTIVAGNDTLTITAGQGSSGVTGAIANIMSNDTIGGVAASTLNTVLTTETSNPKLTLQTSGRLDVASSTAPGTYVLVYRLTDINEPSNYKLGTITITVTP